MRVGITRTNLALLSVAVAAWLSVPWSTWYYRGLPLVHALKDGQVQLVEPPGYDLLLVVLVAAYVLAGLVFAYSVWKAKENTLISLLAGVIAGGFLAWCVWTYGPGFHKFVT